MCDVRDPHFDFTNHLRFVKERQDNKFLTFLYTNPFGVFLEKIVVSKFLSDIIGHYYDSKGSVSRIKKFVKTNQIDLEKFKEKEYTSFNDFFTREKKEITFSNKKEILCSPCDGYLSVYQIEKESTFQIKGLTYTIEGLLQNYSFAKKYEGGLLYVFRLTPKDYHRYHYFDDGNTLYQKRISGVYHTVRPVALEKKQVFLENNRVYTLLSTKNFGDVIFMEVGALAVGKILNHEKKSFKRGEEKGMFLFGGSTILLLFEKDVLKRNQKLLENTLEGYEAVVQCGCVIGERL